MPCSWVDVHCKDGVPLMIDAVDCVTMQGKLEDNISLVKEQQQQQQLAAESVCTYLRTSRTHAQLEASFFENVYQIDFESGCGSNVILLTHVRTRWPMHLVLIHHPTHHSSKRARNREHEKDDLKLGGWKEIKSRLNPRSQPATLGTHSARKTKGPNGCC